MGEKLKVGLLLKSETGLIDSEYTGGIERVFLQDIEIFEEKKIPYKAFCAGKFIKRKGFKGRVERLPYPHFLCRLIKEVEFRYSSRSKVAWRLVHWALGILDFFYSHFFVIKARDCDIWYAHQVPILALIRPEKTVIAFHNTTKPIPFFRIFKSRYLRARYYFVSQYVKYELLSIHKGLGEAQYEVLYNGVDRKKFFPGIPKKRGKELCFLYVNAWREVKGIFLLLESIRLLEKKELMPIQFLIAGSPDLWYSNVRGEYQLIKKRVRSLARGLKSVKFIGRIQHSELRKIYNQIDCLLFPSIWEEPFALALGETLACGVPIIAFRVGGNPEILRDQVTGFVLEKKDAEALAKKIEEVSLKPHILREMKSDCLKVAAGFSKKIRQKKLIDFLMRNKNLK